MEQVTQYWVTPISNKKVKDYKRFQSHGHEHTQFEGHSLNIVRDITITVQVKMYVLNAVVTLGEGQSHWTGNGHIDLSSKQIMMGISCSF